VAIETLEVEQQRGKSLDGQIGEEKKTSESVRALLSGVQQSLDSSKSEHAKFQASRIALETELQEMRSAKEEYDSKLDQELGRSEQLVAQLASAAAAEASLKAELDQLREDSQKASGEMSQLRCSLAEALDSSNMYDLSSKAAEQKVDDLTSQLSSLESKIGDLQALERENLEKSSAHQSTIVKLRDMLSQAQVGQNRTNSDLEAATLRVAELEKIKSELEQEIRASRLEIQALRDINQTLEKEILDAQKQYKDLEGKHVELQADFSSLQSARAELESTNAALTIEVAQRDDTLKQSSDEKQALEQRLKASETTVEELYGDIKQLTIESREAHSQLRKSQAVRVSHENALGSIRIRLGASKMAKRGIQVKLTQAEKDLSTLTMQKQRLEATLQNALSDVVEGRNVSGEQKQKIADLQQRHDRLSQRIQSSEENNQLLRDTIQQIERESADYRQEIARLKDVVDHAQVQISSLKEQVSSLTDQRAKDQESLKARRKSIQDVQQAKADLEKALAEKTQLLETQQGIVIRLEEQAVSDKNRILRLEERGSQDKRTISRLETQGNLDQQSIKKLEEEAILDKQSIQQLDKEKANLVRQTDALQQELNNHPTILKQQSQIEKLERELAEARQSAQNLRSRFHDQEKQNGYLRQQQDQYEREVPLLREQLSELRAWKASREPRVRILDRSGENSQPDRRSLRSDDALSTYASSPTLVMHELEPPIEEDEREEYFDVRPPSARPTSRNGTGRSSLKAFRVLGAEAAQSKLPSNVDDETKKQLWEMWSSQHKLNSWHEDDERSVLGESSEQRPATSHGTAPRLRRKLTKKKKVEEFKPNEHGKFYNLVHYGSMSRPHFERPVTPGVGRSFSSKH